MTPFEVADALRACLDAAYDTAVDTGKPAEICHRPGSQAPLSLGTSQDECCSGLGWVRIAGIDQVIDAASAQQPDFNPCDHGDRRLTIELGVARCNPFGDATAGPGCDTWTELALRMDLDATRMRQAVCCLQNSDEVGTDLPVYRVLPGAWEPIDSSGMCAGGIMSVYVWISCREC